MRANSPSWAGTLHNTTIFLIILMSVIATPEDLSYGIGTDKKNYMRKVHYGPFYPIKISKITSQLNNIVKNCILNHPNVIDSPD